MITLPPRFWAKVEKTATCWLWTACCRQDGYSQFWLNGKMRRAHLLAYEALIGPVPAGLVLDHVKERGCVNRNCVNPDHLEPVTRGENIKRGGNAQKTHCPSGHAYDEANTKVSKRSGHRSCRACNRARYHTRKALAA